jgi:predicted methyltransferase
MTALDVATDALGGVVAWYSIIHPPPDQLPVVFCEFHRVLRPGGHLLVAFQVGDQRVHRAQAYGHAVSLDAYRLPPERVGEGLRRAGMVVRARVVREPDPPEKCRQAYLLARKPTAPRPDPST